jgi:MSHA biogenesis protein MshI
MRLVFGKTRKSPGWLAVNFQRNGVCVAHVERKPSALPIVNLVMSHASNKAVDVPALEKIGKELRAERYQCTTLLNHGDYQLLSVDAPNVQPDELKTAIRWRLKDLLDYHIDDATVDVLDVPVEKNASARNHSMFAVAARNQLIEQRQTLFAESKFPLSVIDIPEMAQRNISALMEPEGRGLAMLSFDEEGGLLTVTFSGELYLSRRIDVPLSQLKQDNVEQRNACYERITLELQRSLDHFDRQYHFITLSKLILAPMAGDTGGLQEYLASNMYVPVEGLNLATVLDLSNVPELKTHEAQQRYFMTLGAALREEGKAL